VKIADLRFEPDPIECEQCPPSGCDLTCVWPGERDPQTWEGDQA
jgi:hypothetical protein